MICIYCISCKCFYVGLIFSLVMKMHIELKEETKNRLNRVRALLLIEGKVSSYDAAVSKLLDLWEQTHNAQDSKA